MNAFYIVLAAAFLPALAAQGTTDPSLSLTIRRANQNAVVSWFAANGVSYQMESSSTLTGWSNLGPVMTGAGGILAVTNSAISNRNFYRVRRLAPGANGSAVFNPATGLLTIIGEELDNIITVGRDVGGTILVNNGAVPITGGMATVGNTVLIEVFGRGGHDQLAIDQSGGVMPAAHLFGEVGNDMLTGGSGADMLAGGPGLDFLNGRGGTDGLYGEGDDDSFIWNAGDSSDVIEGGNGVDTLVFNGNGASENIDMAANGSRFRFFRNVANVILDVDGMEQVNFQAFGGADNIVVNNLSGTTVTQVNIDLAAVGGVIGDAQIDTVTVNGTTAADTFNIVANASAVELTGLGTLVRMLHPEGTNDALIINGVGGDLVNVNGSAAADTMTVTADGTFARVDVTGFSGPVKVSGALTLAINGLGGPDTISCTGNLAALVPLRLDGGPDNDTILGSNGGDVLLGGDGNDFVDGNQGSDTALLGANEDTFQWDPGDGNDTVEGQAGLDTLVFNGSGASEIVEASANGARLSFTRNVANILLDADGIEQVNFQAFGGTDNILINSLVGTAVKQVNIDLAAVGGTTGDAQLDTVTVNGSASPDTINIIADAGVIDISGLSARVRITQAESTNDVVVVNSVGGADLVNMNGSDAADTIAITAFGSSARVTATGLPAPVDLSGAETLAIDVFGGADNITVGNLADTAITRVNLDLAAVGGITGDAQADVVTVTGSPAADAINIAANAGAIDVSGLSALVQIVHSERSNDLLIINGAGDGDRVNVNGSAAADTIAIIANGAFVRVDSTALPAGVDLIAVPSLVINALGGADMISCVGNLAALIALQLDGGPGDDRILGSNGGDVILGGDGNDFVDGNQGNDIALLGANEDTFQWDPGDGNDTVEGQAGVDTLIFNGSGASEIMDASANGARLRFTRNVGNIVMDVDGVERVNFQAFGGADNIVVNSLVGTAVTQLSLDLAAVGGVGDAQLDVVTINGIAAAETFNIGANAGAVEISGLGALVRVLNGEGSNDVVNLSGVGGDLVNVNGSASADVMTVIANGTFARVDATGYSIPVQVNGALTLAVNGLGGPDTISCVGNLAALAPLRLDGGPGNDTIRGGNGADVLLGGEGNDFVDGNQGADTAFLGADDDTFQWDPGDGNDVVEGQAGTDVMVFNGAGIGEIFDFSANGSRLRFTRNIGNIIMDVDGVERVDLQALGGADNAVVNSLAGTAVKQVNIDLAVGGAGDGQADAITVNGTAAADTINIIANAGAVDVSGLSAHVRITRPEAANDSLTVNGLGGVDTIITGPGVTALIAVTVNQ